MKNSIKNTLRIGAIILGSVVIILSILVLSLNIPVVQNFVKDRVVSYVETKIKTPISLKRVYISFPNKLGLEELYLEEKNKDTLVHINKLDVGLDIFQLLQNKADFTSIELDGLRANVKRDEQGRFNFDYILDAFASNKDEEKQDSKPFILSLNKIKLQRVNVNFNDFQQGNHLKIEFNNFETKVKDFNLEENIYALNGLTADGLKLKLKQEILKEAIKETAKTIDSLSAKKPMQIKLDFLRFTNFDVDYADNTTQSYFKVLFRELSGDFNNIDLPKNKYDIDQIKLLGAQINVDLKSSSQNKSLQDELPKNPAKIKSKSPNVKLNLLALDDVILSYNDNAQKHQQGFDANHLNFKKLNVNITDFRMLNEELTGSVKKVELYEKSGLVVKNFKTDFAYKKNIAYLKNLLLETNNSILRDEAVITYNSPQQLSSNIGSAGLAINLKNSKIGFSDLYLFAPDLKKNEILKQYPKSVLNIDASLRGKVNDLNINALHISGLGSTILDISGQIKNVTNPNLLNYNIAINELKTTKKDIQNLAPRNSIPSNIELPQTISLKGNARGNTFSILSHLNINTSLGNLRLDAYANLKPQNREKYTILADADNIVLGKLLRNKDLGIFSGEIKANGVGFNPKTAQTSINGNIKKFDFKGYRYTGVNLKGSLMTGRLTAHIMSKDPNANLDLKLAGNLNKTSNIKLNGNIELLNPYKLNLYKEPLAISGKIDSDFSNINPDFLNGYILLENFKITHKDQTLPLQEIKLEALSTPNENKINLKSQVIDASIQGKYKLTQISDVFLKTLNNYYEFSPASKYKKNLEPNQNFTLNAKVKDDNLLRIFVPDLKYFDGGDITGAFDSNQQKIEFQADFPVVEYAEYKLSGLSLNINNSQEELRYRLGLTEVTNENLALHQLDLNGTINNNNIGINFSTKDSKGTEQYALAGIFRNEKNINKFSFIPQGLMLNYDKWQVEEQNVIGFGKEGIFADNFNLTKGNSSISLQSQEQKLGSPLNISISNFKVEDITEMVKKDSLIASGSVNGNALVSTFKPNLKVDADLNISNLKLKGNRVGNLDIKANTKVIDLIDTKIALTGEGNDVQLEGNYHLKKGDLGFILNLNNLSTKTLEAFALGNIKNGEGYFSGKLNINGTAQKPQIRGGIKFNNVGLEIAKTGTVFKNIEDEIRFSGQNIVFEQFKLRDTENNNLLINGDIQTEYFKKYAFNLDVNAKDFKLVNSEKDNDKMMYGVLSLDTNLRIRGNLDLPKVDGTLSVTDATDFTFILPQSTPTKQDREGIVEFVDKAKFGLAKNEAADTLSSKNQLKGMDISVNIDIDKNAKMSLVIDKANGDFVKLQGQAQLTGGVSPSGRTTLVGVYEVHSGAYEISVNMLRRKFEIKKGSTITWNGEPTEADMNITAIYTTETAPLDLVQQQLAGLSPRELNQYKQRIPFNTHLIMKGELMKPEISFDITTEDKNAAVSSTVILNTEQRLAQLRQETSELNKQVFALLLLNRFIGENPFETSSGISAESMAKQSVSRILSQSLNDLAGDLIAGVELNFDLESSDDYSTGERTSRTDLNVALSKKLLNDRLKVSLGSNFGLEGATRPGEQASNIAGDIMVDYMLSKDGRYLLRTYRKNQYQVALQGQVIETGLGFVITLDYNDLREILKKKKNKKQ
ncbi:translocation/assembly module TamB domain-containing protein [Riemerella anatipestifer]|nr:translocation/assembly module TamB domain-containing protein [Riemerella anatipestifer]MDY3533877.1 translocation/assembly module TamB domain-containing protein [Riemerella anatipestifer]MDY3536091.1 translocation/assembly module TamB domain-containing protein [Riemerella anatipestifer]